MAVAACKILSMPGCEQPTMITTPSDVLIADNSRSSSVPGLSETSVIKEMLGAISVFLLMSWKLSH